MSSPLTDAAINAMTTARNQTSDSGASHPGRRPRVPLLVRIGEPPCLVLISTPQRAAGSPPWTERPSCLVRSCSASIASDGACDTRSPEISTERLTHLTGTPDPALDKTSTHALAGRVSRGRRLRIDA